MPVTLPPLTLIVGGAASGKSAYAERLMEATGRPMIYVATAQAFDEEMRAKIEAHKARRGAGWTTVEAPLDLAAALEASDPDAAVLVDCATLWLTNHLLADHDLASAEAALVEGLVACPAPVVVVTNEVGAGIVPDNALSRRFRAAQGRLNQTLATHADRVVTVIAGLPLALKGGLPEGLE
ncbi:bifunctional adenosylcobinamide kinase/adenosylcobinamide-phosphate guanylyltransferase [Maritimibacter sp. UBA3975]|uniref:bifunctional adenosylcobinamide kinase/adenosylcobinamide-phosphate guanylyltransferase n=1 Tax=Maritimibacter sp. UBA3975 TaxID=1946833 RepID=UPI000C0902C9|nr:bifunctional adenosylcobinamide kinase/adenosylcobinamide-phosphate guanylyltransferase [Maritimibacter sp. UBA3975]MAM62729.1 bifunctional adenosylcobinamide kinase/adenosylcobinamide-phosphate guanylyltransferase [Maritimibacter sp.]|tara:strand:- start:7425 stop:7967 length:543 start_codon:yes stop_codon:yes gene_type:complete